LEWLARDVSHRYGLDVALHSHGDLETLPDRYRTCVFRVVQEALTNCVRHSQAHSIDVSVTGHHDSLSIAVHDDGVGFDPARRRSGLGLRGIEERVKELAGTMSISGKAGEGTTLDIRLPLTAAREVPLARAAG
jgi:signal transduction histidine kinase